MSTRRPPTPNHTAPPDIRDTPPSRNTPSVRLISAVPSKAGLSIDSSPTYIPGFNTAVSSRAPTASSGLAPKVGGSTNRRRLVPRKSKLGLSGNTATEHVGTGLPSQPSMSGSRSASTSFSSTVDVVILNDSQGGKTRQTTFSKGKAKASEEFIKSFRQLGTHQSAVRPSSSQGPSARTTSLDVSVDTSSLVDPDVGEIVFVKKPKTRAGLDVMNWDGPPGGLDDDTSESHDDAPTLSRATAAALLKDSTLGRKNSIGRQKGQEPMKSIRQDDKQKDSKWWSIGRSKGRAKGKDEEDDDDDHDDHDDDEHLESRMEGRQSLRVKSPEPILIKSTAPDSYARSRTPEPLSASMSSRARIRIHSIGSGTLLNAADSRRSVSPYPSDLDDNRPISPALSALNDPLSSISIGSAAFPTSPEGYPRPLSAASHISGVALEPTQPLKAKSSMSTISKGKMSSLLGRKLNLKIVTTVDEDSVLETHQRRHTESFSASGHSALPTPLSAVSTASASSSYVRPRQGSIALRAMKSVKSFARLGSWAQSKGGVVSASLSSTSVASSPRTSYDADVGMTDETEGESEAQRKLTRKLKKRKSKPRVAVIAADLEATTELETEGEGGAEHDGKDQKVKKKKTVRHRLSSSLSAKSSLATIRMSQSPFVSAPPPPPPPPPPFESVQSQPQSASEGGYGADEAEDEAPVAAAKSKKRRSVLGIGLPGSVRALSARYVSSASSISRASSVSLASTTNTHSSTHSHTRSISVSSTASSRLSSATSTLSSVASSISRAAAYLRPQPSVGIIVDKNRSDIDFSGKSSFGRRSGSFSFSIGSLSRSASGSVSRASSISRAGSTSASRAGSISHSASNPYSPSPILNAGSSQSILQSTFSHSQSSISSASHTHSHTTHNRATSASATSVSASASASTTSTAQLTSQSSSATNLLLLPHTRQRPKLSHAQSAFQPHAHLLQGTSAQRDRNGSATSAMSAVSSTSFLSTASSSATTASSSVRPGSAMSSRSSITSGNEGGTATGTGTATAPSAPASAYPGHSASIRWDEEGLRVVREQRRKERADLRRERERLRMEETEEEETAESEGGKKSSLRRRLGGKDKDSNKKKKDKGKEKEKGGSKKSTKQERLDAKRRIPVSEIFNWGGEDQQQPTEPSQPPVVVPVEKEREVPLQPQTNSAFELDLEQVTAQLLSASIHNSGSIRHKPSQLQPPPQPPQPQPPQHKFQSLSRSHPHSQAISQTSTFTTTSISRRERLQRPSLPPQELYTFQEESIEHSNPEALDDKLDSSTSRTSPHAPTTPAPASALAPASASSASASAPGPESEANNNTTKQDFFPQPQSTSSSHSSGTSRLTDASCATNATTITTPDTSLAQDANEDITMTVTKTRAFLTAVIPPAGTSVLDTVKPMRIRVKKKTTTVEAAPGLASATTTAMATTDAADTSMTSIGSATSAATQGTVSRLKNKLRVKASRMKADKAVVEPPRKAPSTTTTTTTTTTTSRDTSVDEVEMPRRAVQLDALPSFGADFGLGLGFDAHMAMQLRSNPNSPKKRKTSSHSHSPRGKTPHRKGAATGAGAGAIAEGIEMVQTPTKMRRARPASEQLLGKERPRGLYDSEEGVLSVLDAVTNDLAQLITTLDLEATPSPQRPYREQSADSPLKGRRPNRDGNKSSIESLRPYAQSQSQSQPRSRSTSETTASSSDNRDSNNDTVKVKLPVAAAAAAAAAPPPPLPPLPPSGLAAVGQRIASWASSSQGSPISSTFSAPNSKAATATATATATTAAAAVGSTDVRSVFISDKSGSPRRSTISPRPSALMALTGTWRRGHKRTFTPGPEPDAPPTFQSLQPPLRPRRTIQQQQQQQQQHDTEEESANEGSKGVRTLSLSTFGHRSTAFESDTGGDTEADTDLEPAVLTETEDERYEEEGEARVRVDEAEVKVEEEEEEDVVVIVEAKGEDEEEEKTQLYTPVFTKAASVAIRQKASFLVAALTNTQKPSTTKNSTRVMAKREPRNMPEEEEEEEEKEEELQQQSPSLCVKKSQESITNGDLQQQQQVDLAPESDLNAVIGYRNETDAEAESESTGTEEDIPEELRIMFQRHQFQDMQSESDSFEEPQEYAQSQYSGDEAHVPRGGTFEADDTGSSSFYDQESIDRQSLPDRPSAPLPPVDHGSLSFGLPSLHFDESSVSGRPMSYHIAGDFSFGQTIPEDDDDNDNYFFSSVGSSPGPSNNNNNNEADTKQSFDFSRELKSLRQGPGRRSFAEQLENAFKTPAGADLQLFSSSGEEEEARPVPTVRGRGSTGGQWERMNLSVIISDDGERSSGASSVDEDEVMASPSRYNNHHDAGRSFDLSQRPAITITAAARDSPENSFHNDSHVGLDSFVTHDSTGTRFAMMLRRGSRDSSELQRGLARETPSSFGRLDRSFRLGGPSKDLQNMSPSSLRSQASEMPRLTLSDIIPPPSHHRPRTYSDTSSLMLEDESILKSVFKSQELPATIQSLSSSLYQLSASQTRLDPDERRQLTRANSNASSGRRRRHVRVSSDVSLRQISPRQFAASPLSQSRRTSVGSFQGLEAFDDVRRRFEYSNNSNSQSQWYLNPNTGGGRHPRESMYSIGSLSSVGRVTQPGAADPFEYAVLPALRERPDSEELSFTMSMEVEDTFAFVDRNLFRRRRVESDDSSYHYRPGAPAPRNRNRDSIASFTSPPHSWLNRNGVPRRLSGSNGSNNNSRRASWAEYQRENSDDSPMDDNPAMGLARPGLGDKMFGDGGLEDYSVSMPLGAISASPRGGEQEEETSDSRFAAPRNIKYMPSYDSIIDACSKPFLLATDSLFERTDNVEVTTGSVFGHDSSREAASSNQFRALSIYSMGSEPDNTQTDQDGDTMFSMLGGGRIRRQSVNSIIAGSPCLRVEKRQRASRSKAQDSEMESPSKGKSSGTLFALSDNSSSGDSFGRPLFHAPEKAEESVVAASDDDWSSSSRLVPVFSRPNTLSRRSSLSSTGYISPPLAESTAISNIDASYVDKVLAGSTFSVITAARSQTRIRPRAQGHRQRISQARASRTSVYETIQEELSSANNSPASIFGHNTQQSLDANTDAFKNLRFNASPEITEQFDQDPQADTMHSVNSVSSQVSTWDDTRGVFALRRYYALRDEADQVVFESQRQWADTTESLNAVQHFEPPHQPTRIQELLRQSEQTYGPLPSELRSRRARSFSRPSPYPQSRLNKIASPPRSASKRTPEPSNAELRTSFTPYSASTDKFVPLGSQNNAAASTTSLASLDKPIFGVMKPFSAIDNDLAHRRPPIASKIRPRVASGGRNKSTNAPAGEQKENDKAGSGPALIAPAENLRINRVRPKTRTAAPAAGSTFKPMRV